MKNIYRILYILFIINTILQNTAQSAVVFLDENLDNYTVGKIVEGGESTANENWFTFGRSSGDFSYSSDIAIENNSKISNSNILHISADVKSETKGYFFIGARRMFNADLTGLLHEDLKLHADIKAQLINKDSKKQTDLPDTFSIEFKIESLSNEGSISFNNKGTPTFSKSGSALIKGQRGKPNFKISDGNERYQIVFVVSSSALGFPFKGGNYSLHLYIDNIRFETTP